MHVFKEINIRSNFNIHWYSLIFEFKSDILDELDSKEITMFINLFKEACNVKWKLLFHSLTLKVSSLLKRILVLKVFNYCFEFCFRSLENTINPIISSLDSETLL